MVRAENFLLNHICETDVQYVKEPRELWMGLASLSQIRNSSLGVRGEVGDGGEGVGGVDAGR